MKYYIYRYLGDKRKSYTVVFDSRNALDEDELAAELKQFHDHHGVSQAVVYIYPQLTQASEETQQIIGASANVPPQDIILLPYKINGIVNPTPFALECLYHGTVQILKERNLILQSDTNFHYVNPSGKHSPFFIRTGNVLERNEEINFISLQLLPFINDQDVKTEIRCDTASILTLVYGVNHLRSLFGRHLDLPFNTFSSYINIKSIKKGSLVLISASSSGGLEEAIFKEERDVTVITIIFNAANIEKPDNRGPRRFVINISSIFKELLAHNHQTTQYNVEECKYCSANSIPVDVREDQFIPSKVLIQNILIKKHHVPEWLKNAIGDLTCTNAIFTHKAENHNEKIREIFFDTTTLVSSYSEGTFKQRFKQYIKNSLPVSIDLIAYSEDKASQLLAGEIASFLKSSGKGNLRELISIADLGEIETTESISGILIVAACISNGNRLNAVSRILRKFQNTSIHYFIAILRLPTPQLSKIFISNLESRQGTKEINRVHVLSEIYLPNHNSKKLKQFERTPWLEEHTFLEKKLMTANEFKDIIEKRLDSLDHFRGCANNLFYSNPFNDQTLSLRPNFALYSFQKNDPPSQSDVFFIMACVFHSLRNSVLMSQQKDDDKFLIQHEHVKSILDPENFKRYNDGIIQSCILRLARPSELDYSIDEDYSSKMLSILKSILVRSDVDSAEAIIEFLYSIAIGKLKLIKSHHDDLVSYLTREFNDEGWLKFYVGTISNHV